MSNIRVLVVDDSRQIREFVVQYILEPNDFEVVEATNGAEGMRRVLQGDIDLILLDLEMPQMNGFDVIEALHAQHSEVPVILMTSHGSEVIVIEMFRKGVRDYVIKPFTVDEMLAAIERALREVRLEHEKEALTSRLIQSKRQLEQRLRELKTLSLVGKSVTALIDRDKLLERIVDAALYITGSEEGAILLEDESTGTLREHVRKRRVQGKEQRVSRRTEDELATDTVLKGSAIRTGAMLYAPLKVGKRPIGTLGVSNKVTARFFDDHDRDLLTALADYASIAIENARLLQQVKEAKEKEKQQIRGMFERYVAPSVVEKLMTQPDTVALGGVRREVTILFADIRGFTSFGARVTPEVLVNVLNHHITAAVEAILVERGTLDKFLGDAVMAYFNAPLPQPDHALRAVRAAWRICQAVQESHAHLPSTHQLEFGVGVSTGEVLVGNIGAPQLMSFTVIGDAVNVSRRLQENAQAGQVLICRRVYELVRDYVKAQPMEAMELKGHPQPELVFKVVAVQM